MSDVMGAVVTVKGWTVAVLDNRMVVKRGKEVYDRAVPNYGVNILDLVQRPGVRFGWGQFPDDSEVVFVYDRNDENFGYAFNIHIPEFSEWGYAPFADADDPND